MSDGQGQDIFVERVFTLDGDDLPVRFFRPEELQPNGFACRFFIDWQAGIESRKSCGEDGMQALLLAMRLAHTLLMIADAWRDGRLTLWGDGDLDLPPAIETAVALARRPA